MKTNSIGRRNATPGCANFSLLRGRYRRGGMTESVRQIITTVKMKKKKPEGNNDARQKKTNS